MLRRFGLPAVIVSAVAAFVVRMAVSGAPERERLLEALAQRGRVLVVGSVGVGDAELYGTHLLAETAAPQVMEALRGQQPEALRREMQRARVDGLLVEVVPGQKGEALLQRLQGYDHIAGLRGAYLAPRAAFYLADPIFDLAPQLREAIATVARGVLEGKKPPRINSFPEPLRRVRHVEVMVLLRQGKRARLWRSARGSSIARALITASVVARQRWGERENAMGGPLDPVLPRLDVEVSLLLDDGEIGTRSVPFVDHVFGPQHGVGYEYKGAWRYTLPQATQRAGGGRASKAYAELFVENGLSEDSLGRLDLRLYRLAVSPIAVSPAPKPWGTPKAPPPADGLSDVVDPGEVLPDAAVR